MSESISEPFESRSHPVGGRLAVSGDDLLEQQVQVMDPNQSPVEALSQKLERIKLSARDVLATLSGIRIELADIRFADDGLQGSGGKGDVVLATLVLRVGEQKELKVAVKKLRFAADVDDEKFLRAFANELHVLNKLSHPNIVEIIGFVEDVENGIAWMVFSWEANGNVREFLRSDKWEIPERVSLIQDVAFGLEYLHSRQPPICHGDLKSLNILVNSSFRAVITDFGSARVMRKVSQNGANPPSDRVEPVDLPTGSDVPAQISLVASGNQLTLTGPSWSFRWAAPEILNGTEPDLASDIWAFGWICWEVITDDYPFPDTSAPSLITLRVIEGQLPSIFEDSQLSRIHQLCNVMLSCWLPDPSKRPSAADCPRSLKWIPSTVPTIKGAAGSKIRSAALLSATAETYRLQGRFKEALPILQEGLSIARATGNEREIAKALLELGEVHRLLSEYSSAKECAEQALATFTTLGDDWGQGRSWHMLGRDLRVRFQYAEAREHYNRALECYERAGSYWGRAEVLASLARLCQEQSEFADAETGYNQALEIYTHLGSEIDRASVLVGLGLVYEETATYTKAEDYYNQL